MDMLDTFQASFLASCKRVSLRIVASEGVVCTCLTGMIMTNEVVSNMSSQHSLLSIFQHDISFIAQYKLLRSFGHLLHHYSVPSSIRRTHHDQGPRSLTCLRRIRHFNSLRPRIRRHSPTVTTLQHHQAKEAYILLRVRLHQSSASN